MDRAVSICRWQESSAYRERETYRAPATGSRGRLQTFPNHSYCLLAAKPSEKVVREGSRENDPLPFLMHGHVIADFHDGVPVFRWLTAICHFLDGLLKGGRLRGATKETCHVRYAVVVADLQENRCVWQRTTKGEG